MQALNAEIADAFTASPILPERRFSSLSLGKQQFGWRHDSAVSSSSSRWSSGESSDSYSRPQDESDNDQQRPVVVVLGAAGQTVREITRVLANDYNIRVVAVDIVPCQHIFSDCDPSRVQCIVGDVRDYQQLQTLVTGAFGVIYAATSSGRWNRKAGSVLEVDYMDVYYAAKASLQARVANYVLLSSGCVTRPNTLWFRLINAAASLWYGDIFMDCKMAGEAAVRELFEEEVAASGSSQGYVVIRPDSTLTNLPRSLPWIGGPRNLIVLQSDILYTIFPISRQDVAYVAAAALFDARTDRSCRQTSKCVWRTVLSSNDNFRVCDRLPTVDEFP